MAQDLRACSGAMFGLQLIVEVQDSFSDLLFYDADFGQIVFYYMVLDKLSYDIAAGRYSGIHFVRLDYCTGITSLSRFVQLE